MITFHKNSHTYFYGQKQLYSVTSIIDKYKQPFDVDFWSTYKAVQRLLGNETFAELRKHKDYKSPAFIEWICNFVDQDELLLTIETIKQEWLKEKDDSLLKGTLYHDTKEELSYKHKVELNPFNNKEYEVINSETITGTGFYPEFRLGSPKWNLAGTADKIFIDENLAFVDDYKTNKKIDMTNPFQKMRYPLQKFDDCNYSHYRIQIGMYSFMLEEMGFKIKGTAFTHLNKFYKFSYGHIKKDIRNLLLHEMGKL